MLWHMEQRASKRAFALFSSADMLNTGNTPTAKTTNSGPTTIAGFDNARQGQHIIVMFDDGLTTVDFTGTTLRGNGGADWTPANGDMMRCVYDGTNWRCECIDCT